MRENAGKDIHIDAVAAPNVRQNRDLMSKINLLGYRIGVPGHPALRVVLGVALVIFGMLGFLPVLGFWMVPVGLAVLAIDFPPVRRFQRRMTIRLGNWLHRRWPSMASRFGYGAPRDIRRGSGRK